MDFQTVLIKPASGLCNMRCEYCFYCDEMEKRLKPSYGIMTEDTLKNIMEKILKQASGHICVGFQGGEPTLAGIEFFEKVLYYEEMFNCNKAEIVNTIQTNGLNINDSWCELLKKGKFLVGISLDGIECVHNMYRHDRNGNPTFSKIVDSIKLLEEYEIEYNILTVVTEDTVKYIDEIYDFYKENNIYFQQYIACLDPFEEERNKKRYSLSAETYGIFLERLFKRWYSDWKKGDAPFIRQFENIVGMLLGRCPESCEQRGTCSIQCIIEADGSVYPCDFYAIDRYRLGNLNTDSLDKIFSNKVTEEFLRESGDINKNCKECKYYSLCRGGCRRNRDSNNLNYFCESYKYFFDNCGDDLCKVARYIKNYF